MRLIGPWYVAVLVVGSMLPRSAAADWPMWRLDAARSGATADPLPTALDLHWKRQLPAPAPAWPEEQGKVRFDVSYNLIVSDGCVIVPSMVADYVTAFDAVNGEQRWRFYTNGPVRFAAAASSREGVVLFGSDDGYLYCVHTRDGSLRWKLRGGPDDRRILGNDRLVSMWPVRGAPVVADGTVYFAAGIWPFMGIFIHAVEIDSGDVIWTNSGTGSNYTVQQHDSPAFAGVAPQGYLAVNHDTLLVAGGMTVPAALDRATGEFRYFRPGDRDLGKDAGGFEVVVGSDWFANRGGLYRISDGQPLAKLRVNAVTGQFVVAHEAGRLQLLEPQLTTRQVTVRNKKGKEKKEQRVELRRKWKSALPEQVSHIFFLAGDRLYASDGGTTVLALDLPPRSGQSVPIAWQRQVAAPVWDMLAADGRLFVVDTAGSVYCFGESSSAREKPPVKPLRTASPVSPDETLSAGFGEYSVLDYTAERNGFAIVQDADDALLNLLVSGTEFHTIALVSEPAACNALRDRLDQKGWLGTRVAVLPGHIADQELPPYMASLIVVSRASGTSVAAHERQLNAVFRSLRPYGGVALIGCRPDTHDGLATAWSDRLPPEGALTRDGSWTVLRRPGALPESAAWTHQNADASNSLVSQDQLVRAPLGLLWFGGPPNRDVLPRHGHGPSPQVIGGRLFIEGRDMLRAVDVYTGRRLWQRTLKDIGVYYNNTGHHPGASAIGSNFVSVSDGIYVIWGRRCLRLDPATGGTIKEFLLPPDPSGNRPVWGFLAVDGDYLIAGSSPMVLLAASSSYPTRETVYTRFGEGSHRIVVMNRHSGEVLWYRDAEFNFRHNAIAIGGGHVFCIDRMTTDRLDQLRRRGRQPEGVATLYALDLRDGKEHWKTTDDVFGTWLSYSVKHDVLLQAGSKYRDRAIDESGEGMTVYAADSGKMLWQNKLAYAGPPLLHDDDIITQGAALELLTGNPRSDEIP